MGEEREGRERERKKGKGKGEKKIDPLPWKSRRLLREYGVST